jgi:RNA polymerase sigma-70 factor (ECF subfamily)
MAEDSATHRTPDHAALIVAIAECRDRGAFAELFAHFAPRIKSLLLRSGAPAELAEEVAQDAMLTVWRKAHLFDPAGASASGWIFRIAHNLRIDAARRAQRADRMASEVALELPEVVAPEAIVGAAQMEEKVRFAIAQLSADQLKVITLSFFESRPHSEIAEILQLPLGTVKSRIRLAFQRLRALLDEVA